MNIAQNITELIGSTPMLYWDEPDLSETFAKIALKLENFNPAGSIKDRVALGMVEDAIESGILQQDGEIIEPTSGNTGIGLAMVCAIKKIPLTIVMPENMSIERRKLIQYYGAKIILTPAKDGMMGAIEETKKLLNKNKKAIMLNQFENASNPSIHYKTTAKEIFEQTDGKIDILVAGIGTGGTISGIGKYLKEQNPNIKIIGIEPTESAVIQGKEKNPHGIQGIGAGFIPKNLDMTVVDGVLSINTKDSIETAKSAGKKGISMGISSGAALKAAIDLSKNPQNKNKLIITIIPDDAIKYISTELFEEL